MPDAKKAFNGFKIFGEQHGRGRADSCVIYLTRPINDSRVRGFWDWIQNQRAHSDLKASISTGYTAPGLCDMGGGAWGLDFPHEELAKSAIGMKPNGSAGGFIGDVLGRGYVIAAQGFLHDKGRDLSQQTLTECACHEVKRLVQSMYPRARVRAAPQKKGT